MGERKHVLATGKFNNWMGEMYEVCQELAVYSLMWAEMACGPRNANDVWVLDLLNEKIRTLRKERGALHRLIHEEPEIKTQ